MRGRGLKLLALVGVAALGVAACGDDGGSHAQVVSPDPAIDTVQFGSRVTIVRDDGREQTFGIVGEDEADPAQGTISHVSPLARALYGKAVGDVIKAGKDNAEITAIQ